MNIQLKMFSYLTKSVVAVSMLTSIACLSGCGDTSVRKEALGGGARTPVSVTLLREAGSGESGEGGGEAAGPKITEFGTVKGRILVNGGVPDLGSIPIVGGDQICSAKPVPNQTVEGEDGGLANVFIFLKKVPNVDVPPPVEDQLVFDQEGCVFKPHAQVVQVGRPMVLKNSDPIAHNVKLEGQATTYANTIPPGSQVDYVFEFSERKPAIVKCDFHTFMSAWLMPLDHPWAVVTNPDGTFEIPNVPAGEMEFVVWHEKLDYIERSLTVTVPANGEAKPIEITVDSSKLGG